MVTPWSRNLADGTGFASTTAPGGSPNPARNHGVVDYMDGRGYLPGNLTLELGNFEFALVLWGVPDA